MNEIPPIEFDYKGCLVSMQALESPGGWLWSYEINRGIPVVTMEAGLDSEEAALSAAEVDAKRRIDAMTVR